MAQSCRADLALLLLLVKEVSLTNDWIIYLCVAQERLCST
jgi:hypothetical protein